MVFEQSTDGYYEAREYLSGKGEDKAIRDLDGFSLVQYANWYYSKEEEKENKYVRFQEA